jgi:(2Fe-2S) ferredoxin
MKSSTSLQYRIFVCTKRRNAQAPEGSCQNCGSIEVYQAFHAEVKKLNMPNQVEVLASGCLDRCEAGVVVLVCRTHQEMFSWLPKKVRIKLRRILFPNQYLYGKVNANDVPDIVRSHLFRSQPLNSHLI